MDINIYRQKLNTLLSTFNQQVMKIVSEQGKGVLAMNEQIRTRVRNTGKDSEGGSFSPYSDQYKKYRAKKGRSINFKNFEMTTAMWKDYGIKEKKVEENAVTVISKGTTEQYKIDFQSEYEKKEIIAPSKKEIDEFNKYVNEQVAKLLNIK